jgi:ABC-2 type transport system ATP-binding protein
VAEAVRITDLHKRYGRTVALAGLEMTVPAGLLTGFLGPNGAGKTTTFRCLLGLTRPDRGRLEVLGLRVGTDTPIIVRRVGAIVDEPGLHKALSGRDNLRVAADTLEAGHHRIGELLDFVGLAGEAGRRVEGYSKGMRQRLALAAALLGDPELVLLDEPLDGLDPAGQVQFRDKLRMLTREGKTVVVSSHNLSDIEQLADHVVVINHGRTVVAGPLEELLSDRGPESFRVKAADLDRAARVLQEGGLVVSSGDDGLVVGARDGEVISRMLAAAGLYPNELVPTRSRLEEVFLRLTEEAG